MKLESAKDYGAMSAAGASIIFDAAMERLSRGERFNLGLATGNTMIELYDQLANRPPSCLHRTSGDTPTSA